MLEPDHCPKDYEEGKHPNFVKQTLNWYKSHVQKFFFLNPPFSLLEDFFMLALILWLTFNIKCAMLMNTGSNTSSKWIRCLPFLRMLWCFNQRNFDIIKFVEKILIFCNEKLWRLKVTTMIKRK